jgi:hypothetical protein
MKACSDDESSSTSEPKAAAQNLAGTSASYASKVTGAFECHCM